MSSRGKFYRFNDGIFVKANTYEEAVEKRIQEIRDHKEEDGNWARCTCLGLSHRMDCPEWGGDIPF